MALLCCSLLFAQDSGEGEVPLELLRPQFGEEPCFPKDYVIGDLGRGDAPEEFYQAARRVMAALLAGNASVTQVVFPEKQRLAAGEALKAVGPRLWRMGGGRLEPDGSVSFLIRFVGRETGIAGELYLRADNPPAAPPPPVTAPAPAAEVPSRWQVDDILFESPQALTAGKFGPAGADMAPYERFF